jgi:hypothetical protein
MPSPGCMLALTPIGAFWVNRRSCCHGNMGQLPEKCLVCGRGRRSRPPPSPPRSYFFAYSNLGNAFNPSLVAPGSISLSPSSFNCPTGIATSCWAMPRKPPTPTIA